MKTKKRPTKVSIPKNVNDAKLDQKEQQRIKKGEMPFVILGIIFFTVMIYGLFISQKEYNSLKKNWKYTDGIIYEFYLGTRAIWRLSYDYSVDSNKYQGYGRWYPNTDTLSVGDTIKILIIPRKVVKKQGYNLVEAAGFHYLCNQTDSI